MFQARFIALFEFSQTFRFGIQSFPQGNFVLQRCRPNLVWGVLYAGGGGSRLGGLDLVWSSQTGLALPSWVSRARERGCKFGLNFGAL